LTPPDTKKRGIDTTTEEVNGIEVSREFGLSKLFQRTRRATLSSLDSRDRRLKHRSETSQHPHTAILLTRPRTREEVLSLVLRRLRSIFGREPRLPEEPSPLFGLDPGERARIGTEDDPLRGFEAAMERHEEARRAEQSGDPEKATHLYETSVAEGFVGSHPYELLASLHERRRDYQEALRVCEAFVLLATSGTMPRGAQRSADRKLPWFEARIEHYQRLLDKR